MVLISPTNSVYFVVDCGHGAAGGFAFFLLFKITVLFGAIINHRLKIASKNTHLGHFLIIILLFRQCSVECQKYNITAIRYKLD